ncbi:MAG TPA: single-stranded DNA-binding protein [bacterium]|jgi:single-strand DNA-binding protein|nr:single-stranded DNA-binding protein [bacterium]
MFSLNRAMIIGNATRDPEMRYTPNGQAVTSFGVATNRRWTDRNTGEMQEQVEFHDITAWGKLAENISQIVKKGAPVYVEGRLQTRSWEGQDGAKRQKTEIIADNIIALSSRGGRSNDEENPIEEIANDKKVGGKKAKDEETEIDIEDIPF